MNYPNMSYCMCENTLLALQQVITAIQEEGPQFLRDMGREERQAFQALFSACEDFMTVSEELQDAVEQEDDGQPTEQQEWADFDADC